jgi:hypothetical protein
MNVDGLETLEVDYESEDLPVSVRELRPIVYKDGDSICSVLGSDPQDGIFGCGISPEAALKDWDHHLKERLNNPLPNDEVVEFIQDSMDATKWAVW